MKPGDLITPIDDIRAFISKHGRFCAVRPGCPFIYLGTETEEDGSCDYVYDWMFWDGDVGFCIRYKRASFSSYYTVVSEC